MNDYWSQQRCAPLGTVLIGAGALSFMWVKLFQERRVQDIRQAPKLGRHTIDGSYVYIEGALHSSHPIVGQKSQQECLRYKRVTDRVVPKTFVFKGMHGKPHQYDDTCFELFDTFSKRCKMYFTLDANDKVQVSNKFVLQLKKLYQKVDTLRDDGSQGSGNVNVRVNNVQNKHVIYGRSSSEAIGWRTREYGVKNGSKHLIFGEYDFIKGKLRPSSTKPVVSVAKMTRNEYVKRQENALWWGKAISVGIGVCGAILHLNS